MEPVHVVYLAHHTLLLAIPAFAPAIAVVGVVLYATVRDRRVERRPHNGKDEAP
jgi:hypothetical protein